jgi:hypothetical protein
MTGVIDLQTDSIVGTLMYDPDAEVTLDVQTEDPKLEQIVAWAVVNPLALRGGGEDNGVFYSDETLVSIGDEAYPVALQEFLTDYDYYVELV